MTRLRAQLDTDLPLLAGGGSPFDDFGPPAPPSAPRPAGMDADGALTAVLRADPRPVG